MSHELGILDITKNSSHLVDQKYLMESNGWVMFNGDMTNDPWIMQDVWVTTGFNVTADSLLASPCKHSLRFRSEV